jgi:hypothetical protein
MEIFTKVVALSDFQDFIGFEINWNLIRLVTVTCDCAWPQSKVLHIAMLYIWQRPPPVGAMGWPRLALKKVRKWLFTTGTLFRLFQDEKIAQPGGGPALMYQSF